MRYWGVCFLLVTTMALGQRISGRVVDEISGEQLVGAYVVLTESKKGDVSDSLGYFLVDDILPGRVQVTVSFLGYETQVFNNILVISGKSARLDVKLTPDPLQLDQVVVTYSNRPVAPGKRTIDEEQVNRFAATYYDPARLMATSPDVSIANDQNNEISVRGISPDYNVWRLEGAEIVNPNHLSNAGTITDQPAGTGGGVNILSAQMLGTSSLHFGHFTNNINNSVGGVFDMYLKSGTSDDYQFTTQASLIGFDLAAEGPIAPGRRSSFIANYRYSFTGLLTSMGVDFGGESIGFQDVSFNINLPFRKRGGIKVFGVGGLSFNDFEHKPFDEAEREKDRKDIFYDGQMGLVGASLRYGSFDASVIASGFANRHHVNQYVHDTGDQLVSQNTVNRDESIISTHLKYEAQLGLTNYTFGVVNNFYSFNMVRESLGQLYFNADTYITDRISLQPGLTVSSSEMDTTTFDPRLQVNFDIGKGRWYASAGRYSQLLKPSSFYFASVLMEEPYVLSSNYEFIFSSRYILGFEFTNESVALTTELFYYDFPEVNLLVNDQVETNAFTRGASFTLSKDFLDSWYMLGGANFFDSRIDGSLNSPFNLKHNISLSGGREFIRINNKRTRTLSLNGKAIWQGGGHYTDIPFPTPQDASRLDPFALTLSDYVRLDLRVQWTRSGENRTSSVALDLQNLLFRENDGYVYYDTLLGEEVVAKQLGLIPILTYRLEF